MATKNELRQCPYCKEEIKADALKCKHCRSALEPEAPAHGGTCPLCKESIQVDAIKCKHCGSYVGPAPAGKHGDCDCGSKEGYAGGDSDVINLGTIGGAETGDNVPGGVAQAPSGNNCGECTGFGGATSINGTTRIKGFRTCCSMIPVLVGRKVIWKKFCWTESCMYRDIYAPL